MKPFTYVIPKEVFIGRGEETEALYLAEDNVRESVNDAAAELAKVMGWGEDVYWGVTMPATLLQMLDTFERGAAEAAALSLLRKAGYLVSVPVGHRYTFLEEMPEGGGK